MTEQDQTDEMPPVSDRRMLREASVLGASPTPTLAEAEEQDELREPPLVVERIYRALGDKAAEGATLVEACEAIERTVMERRNAHESAMDLSDERERLIRHIEHLQDIYFGVAYALDGGPVVFPDSRLVGQVQKVAERRDRWRERAEAAEAAVVSGATLKLFNVMLKQRKRFCDESHALNVELFTNINRLRMGVLNALGVPETLEGDIYEMVRKVVARRDSWRAKMDDAAQQWLGAIEQCALRDNEALNSTTLLKNRQALIQAQAQSAEEVRELLGVDDHEDTVEAVKNLKEAHSQLQLRHDDRAQRIVDIREALGAEDDEDTAEVAKKMRGNLCANAKALYQLAKQMEAIRKTMEAGEDDNLPLMVERLKSENERRKTDLHITGGRLQRQTAYVERIMASLHDVKRVDEVEPAIKQLRADLKASDEGLRGAVHRASKLQGEVERVRKVFGIPPGVSTENAMQVIASWLAEAHNRLAQRGQLLRA